MKPFTRRIARAENALARKLELRRREAEARARALARRYTPPPRHPITGEPFCGYRSADPFNGLPEQGRKPEWP